MNEITPVQAAHDALSRATLILQSSIAEASTAEDAHAAAVNDLRNAIAANLMAPTAETKQRLEETGAAERDAIAKRDYASLTVDAARQNVTTLEQALADAQHREASDTIQAAFRKLGGMADEIDATISRLFTLIAEANAVANTAEDAASYQLNENSLSHPGAWRSAVMHAIKERTLLPSNAFVAPCSVASATAQFRFNRMKGSNRYTPTNAETKETA
ncbi:hypothetical protein HUE56_21490 [Azospirillum oryzae]|uniref:Uncharacterized protein n=1 Tax=Azospirillum oryzae TaxID=286727 RepID=A0A6N1AYU1_9PROT|nr:hypothetical protein [Azospirillum oryzae]KAA0590558.1 hypothetical protein FZ938_00125 [Azospirillum oryzae]QKS52922.1 hypothetical protein HUE56_21490 [Azospirillum oryzae]GLR80136.1 hypothetical protein GCM10007856_28130 [Azospirillum oryzae]